MRVLILEDSILVLRTLFIIAVIGLGISLYRWSGRWEPAVALTPVSTLVPQQSASVAMVTTTSVQNQASQNMASDELAAEQRSLQDLQEDLVLLRNQRAAHDQALKQGSLSVPLEISNISGEIQNLSEILQSQRAQESSLQESARTEIELNVAANQASRAQIEESMRQVSQNIQTVQAQLSQVGPPMTDTERENTNLALQPQLASLQQQLNDLYAQRANLDATLSAQMQNVNASLIGEQSALVADQDSVQSEIFSLRDRARELRSNQGQTRMSLMSLDQQIRQTEAAVENQRLRVQQVQGTSVQ